jgi:hypothetical protein
MSLLSTKLSTAQLSQVATNVSASQAAGVPSMSAGAVSITLPELFVLPYLGAQGDLIYRAATLAALGDINAKHALTDLQTYAKVAVSNKGVLFDCTTSASLYYSRNMCYDPDTGLPRTAEQLFPTLVVELAQRGQPLSVSLAPTVLGEGWSRGGKLKASYSHAPGLGSYLTGKAGLSKGVIAGIVVVVLVLVVLFGVVGYRHWKSGGGSGSGVSGAIGGRADMGMGSGQEPQDSPRSSGEDSVDVGDPYGDLFSTGDQDQE